MNPELKSLSGGRVLVSGHIPPPMGGIAMFYQSLLGSSLPKKVNLMFVQTSSQKRDLADAGKASLSNAVSAVQDCIRFFKAVVKHKPQVSHIATAPGFSFLKHSICVLIANLFGSKILIHPHCSLAALYTDRPERWQKYVRWVLKRTDGLIALSKEWKQIEQILPGLPVFLLPNAINQDDYRLIAQSRINKSPARSVKNVLYLGYLGKTKGTFDLVEAARLVLTRRSDVIFHLVGGELARGEREALQQKINALGLNGNVRLHEPVEYAEKLEYFRQADIFVYPSYYEGMPMAVIEAMASGLPVVASNVGGLPDLVMDNENGLLTPPGDPWSLSDSLNVLLDNVNLCHAMQQKSSKLAAEKYDIEKLVDELIRIYAVYLPRTAQIGKWAVNEGNAISNNGHHPNEL